MTQEMQNKISLLEKQFVEMSGSIQYIKENIEKFVSTHDSVIQLQVRVSTLEKENVELKTENKNVNNSIQSLWIKIAGLSGIVSFLVAVFSNIGEKIN